MKLDEFDHVGMLKEQPELEKVARLAFYLSENKGQSEFDVNEICDILTALGYAKPNTSRLKQRIQKSKDFLNGKNKDSFRISIKARDRIRALLPNIRVSEQIISDDSLIPEILFTEVRRSYLTRLAQQINAAYENNLFDAAALLMRRLLEILLIHVFQAANIEQEIMDSDGSYQNLKTLINKAKSRSDIGLSPSSKKAIDDFRELGNLSAHRITYNCRRADIRQLRLEYRAIIEELLYKAGLRR